MPRASVAPAGLGLDSAAVRQRMVQRLRAEGAAQRAGAGGHGRGAAPPVRRQRAGHPGLRRHQPADRPRADDLQALGGGAHDRAAVRGPRRARSGTSGACWRSAPAAATRRRCWRCWRSGWCRSSGCRPLHDKARAQPGPAARRGDVRLVYGDGMLGHAPNAPYDSIIAAAGGERLPAGLAGPAGAWAGAWWRRCTAAAAGGQVLLVVDRAGEGLRAQRARGGALRPPKIRASDDGATHGIDASNHWARRCTARCVCCWSRCVLLAGLCVAQAPRAGRRPQSRAGRAAAAAHRPPRRALPPRRRPTPKPLPGAENAGKPGYYTVKPGDTLIRIGAGDRPELARHRALEQPRQPEPDRGRAGAARGAAGRRPAVRQRRARCQPPEASRPAAGCHGRRRRRRAASSAAAARRPPRRRLRRPRLRRAPAARRRRATPTTTSTGSGRPPGRCWPASTNRNKGLAIAGKAGDPVLAAADGRVVYAGSGLRGYGNLVIVKHNTTYLTAYAHNQTLLVKEDQVGAARPEDRRDGLQRRRARAVAFRDPPAGQAGRSGASCCRRASSGAQGWQVRPSG